MAHRRDEAERPARLRHAPVSRRTAGRVVHGIKRPDGGEVVLQLRQADILVGAVTVDLSHRHGLDQGDLVTLAVRPGDHGGQLGAVVAGERHGVDLHLQPRRRRRLNASQHLGEVAAPSEGLEEVGLQRVEGDVDALDAEPCQLARELFQPRAIGGEGQLFQCAGLQMSRQALHQLHEPAADEGFTAGEAKLLHAQPHKGRRDAVKLLDRQHFALGQEDHVLGHAVDAAQVAAVRDGDAQIADAAAKRVDHGPGFPPGGEAICSVGVVGRHAGSRVQRRK